MKKKLTIADINGLRHNIEARKKDGNPISISPHLMEGVLDEVEKLRKLERWARKQNVNCITDDGAIPLDKIFGDEK